MLFLKFKIIPNSPKNSWVGWFGDDVIKVRLTCSRENSTEELIKFITNNLGIKPEDIQILKSEVSSLISLNCPDQAFELFWSAIDK